MVSLSIKIKIADRIYPIKVDAADEAAVRKAGKILEERIRNYQQKLRIQDQQDLLAMVAFDCLVESLKMHKITERDGCIDKIATWSSIIEEALKNSIRPLV